MFLQTILVPFQYPVSLYLNQLQWLSGFSSAYSFHSFFPFFLWQLRLTWALYWGSAPQTDTDGNAPCDRSRITHLSQSYLRWRSLKHWALELQAAKQSRFLQPLTGFHSELYSPWVFQPPLFTKGHAVMLFLAFGSALFLISPFGFDGDLKSTAPSSSLLLLTLGNLIGGHRLKSDYSSRLRVPQFCPDVRTLLDLASLQGTYSWSSYGCGLWIAGMVDSCKKKDNWKIQNLREKKPYSLTPLFLPLASILLCSSSRGKAYRSYVV